jgi:S-DNA-T family DNA segregation ATPase FtsK/SpoIIIE
MLFQAPDEPSPKRLQGVFLTEQEIQRLVHFWVRQAEELKSSTPSPEMSHSMEKVYPVGEPLTAVPLFDEKPTLDEDPYLEKAIAIVREEERASISMLQRKLRIGYTRAARMIDRMEELEIVGKADPGSGMRAVLDFGDEQETE